MAADFVDPTRNVNRNLNAHADAASTPVLKVEFRSSA